MDAMRLPQSTECFNTLLSAYSERHRYYHTTEHISAMLRHFDNVRELAEHPNEVESAIWFHDAIYKPFSSTNEADSADWAKDFLTSNHYNTNGTQRIYDMIMATLHDGNVDTADQKLLIDIDLSILGAKPHVYDQFEQNVRKEYKFVPKFLYRQKRKQILQTFLHRDAIYNTEHFKNKFENNAKENIKRAIQQL